MGWSLRDKWQLWRRGFKVWKGGKQPVAEGLVEYVLRGQPNTVYWMDAEALIWTHDGGGMDVVAYRIVP